MQQGRLQESGPKYRFGTAFYVEGRGWAAAGAPEIMARLLAESTASDKEVVDTAAYLGRSVEEVRDAMVAKMQPTNEEQKKGRFGEILHAEVLEAFQGMTVVSKKKYRYNPAPNASVHGVDLIALTGASGGGSGGKKCERLVYAETKLRTVRDAGAVVKAYEALAGISDDKLSASLVAEIKRQGESDPCMFKRLVSAARRQEDNHYRIGVIIEKSEWSDSHLDALARRLDPARLDMAVDIVRIRSLRGLVQESYRRAG